MRRVRVPFVNSSCNIPVVPCSLSNGTVGLAIIDTGSDTSLIDKNFVLNNKSEFKVEMTDEKVNFSGLSSTQSMPVVNAQTTIRFHRSKKNFNLVANVFPMDFVIAMKETYDIAPDILIGSDMLKQLNADINYEKKELVVQYNDLSC